MHGHGTAAARWGDDGFFFTEAARGGPLAWRTGEAMLEGDALGPVRHAHDGAGEFYFMFSGSAHVETGGREFVLEEGELGYIPPDVPHNFLGPASDRDACLFCVVTPNFVDNKWRVRDFLSSALDGHMAVARPFVDEALPGDEMMTTQAFVLSGSEAPQTLVPAGFDVVYLVVEGTVQLVSNGLHGSMEAGTYIHLRDGQRHALSTDATGKVLRFDCRFEAWKGVPLGRDAADEPA